MWKPSMATPVAKDERSCSDADAAATSVAVHDEDPAERAVSDEAQTPRKRKLNEVAGGDAGTGGTAAGGEDIEAPVDRGSAAGANAERKDCLLIPADFVSFWKPSGDGGFTPIYEAADDSSYADTGTTMASVNAGAFRLYVGGAAINRWRICCVPATVSVTPGVLSPLLRDARNLISELAERRAFAQQLKAAGHDVSGYEDMHWNFLVDALKHVKTQPDQTSSRRQLHHLSDLAEGNTNDEELVRGVADISVLLSPLPRRFIREQVRAGTIFIDSFTKEHRPCENPANSAMIYAVGPEGDQAEDADDFIMAVQYTGENMYRAVTLYNQSPPQKRPPIDFVRVCLVSGGLFKHEEVSKTRVAEALISGMSTAFFQLRSETDPNTPFRPPHVNFAYDENVFHKAYTRLQQPAAARSLQRHASAVATASTAKEGVTEQEDKVVDAASNAT